MNKKSGLREFAEWIEEFVNTTTPEIRMINDRAYIANKEGIRILSEPKVEPVTIHTLDGICEYITSGALAKDGFSIDSVMLVIEDEKTVNLISNTNNNGERATIMRARAMTPTIHFDTYFSQELFVVMMQSCFVRGNEDNLDFVLEVVGNIAEENVRETADDGVTQVVTVKSGVTLRKITALPNPVTLTPYRSFIEIEQPTSNFLLRMDKGPALKLIEADGAAWKIQAMQRINDYIYNRLSESECADVVILS